MRMRCVAGHQANLYPYGGFFAKAASAAHFVIVDTTQYVKREYHNRNRVKLSNGAEHWLTIPVKTAGRFDQALGEVEIDDRSNWQREHLRCFELNYAKSTHFDRYFPRFRALLEEPYRLLADYAIAVIRCSFDILGITTPVSLSSELGARGKNVELVADLCRKTGFDAYLHGKHAHDYIDFEFLKAAGIRSFIQEWTAAPYPQPWGPFIGNLCILDVIFNCGPESLVAVMAGNRIRDVETDEVVGGATLPPPRFVP
jgi:hypothetical protein